MAINQQDLDLIRNEFEAKLASVSLDHMQTATAIGSYGERFTGVEARIDAVDYRLDSLANEIDRRFDMVGQRFDAVDRCFDRIDERFELVNHRFEQVDRRFDAVDQRFEQVDQRFDTTDGAIKDLREKLESRFGWQTFMTVVLGALILFDEAVRALVGL